MHDDERFGGPTPDGSMSAPPPPHTEVMSSSDGLVLSAPSILADGGAPLPERHSRKRGIAMVAAAVLVLGAGAGAFAVGSALSGGGAQPESVVPASAVFYAEVDLDPSAAQKVDAFRFLRTFPQLKDTFTADGGFGPGFAKLFDGSSVDYAKDVEPWLGKRYAVALVPGATKDQVRLELVVQVTDEKAATTSLEALIGKAGLSGAGVVVRDGYAIIAVSSPGAISADGGAPTGAAAQISAEAQTANLESSAAYTSAIAPYGSGVVTVWSDNGGFSKLASTLTAGLGGGLGGLGGTPSKGYSVSVLRFDGGTLELVGSTTGSTTTLPSGGVPAFFALPDSTLAAVGGSGVGRAMKDAVAPYLDSLGSLAMLGGLSTSSGGSTPGDLTGPFGDPKSWPTLFGDQTVLAVGGGSDAPDVGVHVVGGQKTVAAVTALVDASGDAVSVQPVADGVVVASSDAWLKEMAGGGSFGTSAQFRSAVPDAERASVVGFVDISGMVERFGADLSASDRATLAHLKAVGLSVTTQGDTLSYRVRLLTD